LDWALQGFGEGMNLQVKIDRIKNNLDAQAYTVAAGEAVKIIEIAFRKSKFYDGWEASTDNGLSAIKMIDIGKRKKAMRKSQIAPLSKGEL